MFDTATRFPNPPWSLARQTIDRYDLGWEGAAGVTIIPPVVAGFSCYIQYRIINIKRLYLFIIIDRVNLAQRLTMQQPLSRNS